MRKTTKQDARLLWQVGARLGEGPLWDEREQALYWVDLRGQAFFRHHPASGENRRFSFRGVLSTMVRRNERAGFLAACGRELQFLDSSGARIADTPSICPEPARVGNRLNDGKCDPQGRFWFGTMDDAEKAATGSLYMMDADLQPRRMDDGYTVSNGPAFSPDGTVLYHADSPSRTIYAFDVGTDASLSGKREHVRLRENDGYPDGMTVDSQGYLWVGIWNGWRLQRFDPAGRAVTYFSLPVAQVSSCAFGGPDLTELYITTAAMGTSPQPLAGSLFCAEPNVKGLRMPRFVG